MNTEHPNTSRQGELEDEIWEVFLPDGEDEPLPEEGDFWFQILDEPED
ncbi:hypothetical protein [Aeoliella sp.]